MRYKGLNEVRISVLGSLMFVLTLQGLPSFAETQVYKSTDTRGQVTYGDKPASGAVTVEDLGVTASDAILPEEELQKRTDRVVATTNRLRDDRLQREKARAEARPPPPAPPIVIVPAPAAAPLGYIPRGFGYPDYHQDAHNHHGVPFNIDVQGESRDFRYGASIGHHQDHGRWEQQEDRHHAGSHGPPYRERGLLRHLDR